MGNIRNWVLVALVGVIAIGALTSCRAGKSVLRSAARSADEVAEDGSRSGARGAVRGARHLDDDSEIEITAFCTRILSTSLPVEECQSNSRSIDTSRHRYFQINYLALSETDLEWRFNKQDTIAEDEVWPALQTLGRGCHNLEIRPVGNSDWSATYAFCVIR